MGRLIKVEPGQPMCADDLLAAAQAMKACRVVAFPTDTVYGLGTTALVKAAQRRVYDAKGRDAFKPLPVLIHSAEEAKRWVQWTPAAEALAARYWPGALTLVLKPTREGERLKLQLEFPTLAVRVPSHPIALALIRAVGGPLAVTSANLSGKPALADGGAVAGGFLEKVEIVIDAGAVSGLESTVVDATGVPVRVSREGALRREDVLETAKAAA